MNISMIKFKFLSWNFGYDNKKIMYIYHLGLIIIIFLRRIIIIF